ncbi:MAG: hypothetical protein K8T89_19985 [Planctomycetes bacterium]|nr:hypothetical protein [Planctomycetota bacterium]
MEFEEVEGTSNDSNGWESRAMAVSQDSKMVASTNGIDSIWLWDVATGKEIRKLSFDKSPQMYTRVASLSFSRDGKKLATVIGNQSGGSRSYIADYAAVWDVHEGKLTHEVPPKEKDGSRRTSYRSTIILTHAEFDVSGENLVIDHTVGNAVWEIATGKKSQSFTDGWRSFFRSFVHPDGELVIVVADRTLFCENKKTGKEVWRRELFR